MSQKFSGICISAQDDEEHQAVKELVHKLAPDIEIIDFQAVLQDQSLLAKCDFIFTIGGDGSVAWLVGTFFQAFGSVKNLKPIVPVTRPESVGYLKQLELEENKFLKGFRQILDGYYSVESRTVLTTEINNVKYISVNEIFLYSAPHLAEYTVLIKHNDEHYHPMTSTMADGAMVTGSLGSTGWALSYNGQIILNENSLQVVFAGGLHSSANFLLPRKSIKLRLKMKNPVINSITVDAFQRMREEHELPFDGNASETLKIVYGPRVIIDGKLVAFDIKEIEINSDIAIPFVFLHDQTVVEKARKLTQQPNIK
ncbi:MAG: NAD(+)/NADH kinase [Candidatus Heimdallarchaeota archaeon]|nr:NAD(+)/NADH kinase [Candidatus Heimdallarchaeota archaeon]